MTPKTCALIFLSLFLIWPAFEMGAETENPRGQMLSEFYMRDACVLPLPETEEYLIIAAGRGATVRGYKSKDLVYWEGPYTLYETPQEMWGEEVNIKGIWAPEIHAYRGKYYLFLTFDSDAPFAEQWRDWLPRVRRASQVLVSDNPLGPFKAFSNEPTLPADIMTLDGTLWEEDGVPYMVYCHEWVQISNGTIEMIELTEDLSATVGEPTRMLFGSDGPWAKPSDEFGSWVTDGPYFYVSKSGKLFMPWSSFSETGYTVGLAISNSGKLEGPWRQQEEPIYRDDGGHSMLFERFDGQLMMALHTPNNSRDTRIQLFEMEDTGESLRILRKFPE